MTNPNVLSQRYATDVINRIFSGRGKVKAMRELWIAVLKAQSDLGLDVPGDAIEKYEAAIDDIDLERIDVLEVDLRHDLKANIQAFNEAAGVKGYIHRGLTSRDITDNVELMQLKRAGEIIFGKYVSVLRHMLGKSLEYKDIVLTARTHHQAAQLTVLGRRMSMWSEELLEHLTSFRDLLDTYPLRGIKGPVGTRSDMRTLLGSSDAVEQLEKKVAKHLGFSRVLQSTGQVYPRSLDLKYVTSLALLSAACENFANGMRLMAGYDLVTEGFKEGQVGSSAMPHKMNTRSSERIWAFSELLKMYSDGASRLSGQQWEEGDVSCSAVRRVILPDALYTSDGLCETTLTVLNEMGAYQPVIAAEVDRYLPFLATTQILMEAVQAGADREEAYGIIKRHAIPAALALREGRPNPFLKTLAADESFRAYGIDGARLEAILGERERFIGDAQMQIDTINEQAAPLLTRYAEQAAYEPEAIR